MTGRRLRLHTREVRLDARPAALRPLRRAFREFVEAEGRLHPDLPAVTQLELAVREAAANIIEHIIGGATPISFS